MTAPEERPQSSSASEPSPTRLARRRLSSNLVLRGASALAALGLLYYSMVWDITRGSAWGWTLLVSCFSLMAMREFYRLAEGGGARPFSLLGYGGGVAWLLATEWSLSGAAAGWLAADPGWLVILIVVVGTMLLQLTRRTNEQAIDNVAATLFGIVYCAILPGVLIHIHHLGLAPDGWPAHGVEFVIVCIFIAKVADVGALLIGSRWGKHKLIPRLSPGKTWEGAVGGLLFSVFLLQLMVWTEPRMALAQLGWGWALLLSVLLAAGSLAGDLIESAFKRSSNRKDAGAGVPGFGGVLDLTDSLMIAGPVLYFFLLACGAKYVGS